MIPRCAQEILVEVRCGCVIVQGNDSILNRLEEWLREQYQKHHPIKPTIDQSRPTKQAIGNEWTTENHQPTKQLRSNDSSKSGRIATKQTTYLRAVELRQTLPKKRLTKHKNEYKHRQRSWTGMSSGSEAKNLEPARALEPTAKPDIQEIDVEI